jgi:glycosyltransferase involved in cell wall biosynthesis
MKIAHVVLNGRLDGGQRVCFQILREARQRGYEVALVSPDEGELTTQVRSEGIPLYLFGLERTFQFNRALTFADWLKKEQVHLVHTHTMVPGDVLARIAARLAGIPIISHIHAYRAFSQRPTVRTVQRLLDNATARLTAAIIAVSEALRTSLIEQGYPASRIWVIHNGVQVECLPTQEQCLEIRRELGFQPTDRLVAVIGRVSPAKGIRELVLAAPQVLECVPSAHFLVIGEDVESEGQFRRNLERQVMELGINRHFHFLGHHPNAARLMHALDLFVLPSWIEGLPITILEAMAAAKPVIATPVGGVPELVVDGETGILIPPQDVRALADAIIQLLENPELRTEMGQRVYERVRAQFSLSQMLEQVFDVYQHVMCR